MTLIREVSSYGRPGLASTARTPGVLLGALGSVMLALSSSSRMFSEDPNGWPWAPVNWLGTRIGPITAVLLLLAGWFSVFGGWWLIRPGAGRGDASPAWTLTLWSLPMLLAPPTLSPDAFLYADLGWILHLGADPYEVGLTTLGGPYAASVDPLWAGQGVAYPPLALRAHWLGVVAVGLHPYWGMIAQRVLALGGVALVAAFLPRLAETTGGSARWAAWFGTLNPLLLLLYVGGAHNDAMMAGLVVVALWVAARPAWGAPVGRMVVSAILVGLAMGFKQQAGLAAIGAAGLPIVGTLRVAPLGHRLGRLAAETLKAAGLAVMVFAITSWASGLGFGWVQWLHVMELAKQERPLVVLPGQTLNAIGLTLALAALLGMAWVTLARAQRPLQVVAVGSALAPFLAAVWHPWYAVLGLVLLGGVPPCATARRVVGLDPAPAPEPQGKALQGASP